MPIDIGGAFTISGLVTGVQSFKIAGAANALVIDPQGRTTYPNQIAFLAGGYGASDPGWWGQPNGWSVWNYMNNVPYNVGGGYANNRFTAPVAGAYLFHWTCYHYKPGAGQGNYIHPMFFVNGGERNVYRMLGYWAPAGYSFDSDMMDIIYLNAGDYVDVHIYFGGTGMSGYPHYSQFSGCLVG